MSKFDIKQCKRDFKGQLPERLILEVYASLVGIADQVDKFLEYYGQNVLAHKDAEERAYWLCYQIAEEWGNKGII